MKGFKKKEAEGETVTIKEQFFKRFKTMKAFKLKSHRYEKIADTFSHDASRENVDVPNLQHLFPPAHDFGRDGKSKIAEKLHAGIDKEFEKIEVQDYICDDERNICCTRW